jgi:hypothetical protein
MTIRILTRITARVDWPTLIPTLSPFAAYVVIMLLVLAFGE